MSTTDTVDDRRQRVKAVVCGKSFADRVKETERLRREKPGMVPLLVRLTEASMKLAPLRRTRYLVPKEYTVGNALISLRKDISASHADGPLILRFGEDQTRLDLQQSIEAVDDKFKDKDGFLYAYLDAQDGKE